MPGSTQTERLAKTRPMVTRLLQKIRKAFGPIEAGIVVEWTKKGSPHFHLLARSDYLPQKWISKTWAALTGAYVVDIRAINDAKKAAWYVCKYVTKSIMSQTKDNKVRSYAFTKGYLTSLQSKPTATDFLYEVTHDHPSIVIARMTTYCICSPKSWGWEFIPTDPSAEAPPASDSS